MGRRQMTTAITMVVLCGILVAAALWGWRSLFADLPGDATSADQPSGSCTTDRLRAGQRLRASQVQVSVFNDGTESGLADTTLAALRKRGFRTGEVGNAPTSADVDRVQVWTTQPNDLSARLVARQFGKNVRVKFSDDDLGPGVDVIVGNGFRRLAPAPGVIKVRKAQQVCVGAKRS